MKTTFILKGKNNPTNVICRINPTKLIDYSCATGIWVKREEWNETKQQVKLKANNTNKDLINSNLQELETAILDKWNFDNLNKNSFSKNWLKDVINVFFGKATTNEQYKIYFIDWIIKFIQEAPKRLHKGKPLAYKTIQQYSVTLKKLQAFELVNDRIRFENIDLKFYRNFIDYCRNIENLGDNSIGGHIKNIKMWCKNIDIDGLPINSQYKSSEFSSIQGDTKDIYFNETEIDTLFNFDFSHNFRLANARDLLIISLRTGLRISDFMRLGVLNIKDEKIRIETKKTKQKVVIAMHSQIKHILTNGLPHAISDQKYNDYIKEIAYKVGFVEVVEGAKMNPETKRKENGYFAKNELVTSHIGRRSFATNLYGKLPNKVIMACTGHTTETQFLKYIKTTNDEFAEILGDFWNKETTNQTIQKPNLKAI